MKKRLIGAFLLLAVLFVSTRTTKAVVVPNPTRAANFYEQPTRVRCTCYIDRGTMASGKQTHYGAIAGRREWLGKVAVLYRIENGQIGECLGMFEFLDTGAGMDTDGDGKGDTIKNGYSVDVWMPSMEDARNWIRNNGDYVYMQIIDGEG